MGQFYPEGATAAFAVVQIKGGAVWFKRAHSRCRSSILSVLSISSMKSGRTNLFYCSKSSFGPPACMCTLTKPFQSILSSTKPFHSLRPIVSLPSAPDQTRLQQKGPKATIAHQAVKDTYRRLRALSRRTKTTRQSVQHRALGRPVPLRISSDKYR